MNAKAKTVILTCAICAVCVAVALAADPGGWGGDGEEKFQSPKANKAVANFSANRQKIEKDYQEKLASLRKERNKAILAKRDKLAKVLETARKAAMKADNLADAVKLDVAAKKLLATDASVLAAEAEKAVKAAAEAKKAAKKKTDVAKEKTGANAALKKINGYVRVFNAKLPKAEELNKQRDEKTDFYTKTYVKQSILQLYNSELYTIKRIGRLVKQNKLQKDTSTRNAISQMASNLRRHQQSLLNFNSSPKKLRVESRLSFGQKIDTLSNCEPDAALAEIEKHIKRLITAVNKIEVYTVKAKKRKARMKTVTP